MSKKELTSQRGGHQNLQFFYAGDFPFFSCQTVVSFDDAVDGEKSKCEIGRVYRDESAMPESHQQQSSYSQSDVNSDAYSHLRI